MSSEMSSLRKAAFGADSSISAAPPLIRPLHYFQFLPRSLEKQLDLTSALYARVCGIRGQVNRSRPQTLPVAASHRPLPASGCRLFTEWGGTVRRGMLEIHQFDPPAGFFEQGWQLRAKLLIFVNSSKHVFDVKLSISLHKPSIV
jgi:hypothetical protein